MLAIGKKANTIIIFFLLMKSSFCQSIKLINDGKEKIFISNSDYFGKGSSGISLYNGDSNNLKCATENIIISIGYGNGTQSNHFIVLENKKTYLLSKINNAINVLEKDKFSHFANQSTQISNFFFNRFKSMQYDFEPIVNQSLKLTERHKFLLSQYLEKCAFLDSLSLNININNIIIENWKSLLYCNYLYNLYNYQTYKYINKNKITSFYKDSTTNYLLQISNHKFLENQISAIAYNKLLSEHYNKNISQLKLSDFTLTNNQLFNDFCISSILNSKINSKLSVDSIELYYYLKICKNDTYKSAILENLRLNSQLVVEIEQKNDFLLINNFMQQVSFDSIIKLSFKRKIYIDFWASWCIPCINEIKDSYNMRTTLLKENYVYVYISLDENLSNYENASQVLALNNYSYSFFAKNKNHPFITKFLKVTSLPRYSILVKGKIVDSNAPRPTNAKFLTILNKY